MMVEQGHRNQPAQLRLGGLFGCNHQAKEPTMTTHEQSETIDRNDPGLYEPGVIECACCNGSGVITIGRNADEYGEFAETDACDACDGAGVIFVETKPSGESWTTDQPHTAELVDGGAR